MLRQYKDRRDSSIMCVVGLGISILLATFGNTVSNNQSDSGYSEAVITITSECTTSTTTSTSTSYTTIASTTTTTLCSTTESTTTSESTTVSYSTKATQTTTTEPEQLIYGVNITLTDSEIYLLATLVYLEAGAESYECQMAIASSVINRIMLGEGDLRTIVYAPKQYSVAHRLASSKPDDEAMSAVMEVMTVGTTIPIYVTAFRAGYYHSWGDQVPYKKIDHTYFSYSAATRERCGE